MSNSERERVTGSREESATGDTKNGTVSVQSHYHMPLVRAALAADVPVWLHGEAGSGKSTAGKQAADSLGLPFRSVSLGPTTSKSDLMGYRDATGDYHSTAFREIYKDGGVFLFDKIDNGSASILTILNSALANGHGEFPDSRVPRHETARFIASANTIGRGATSEYLGRAPIDAATIDRFAFIPMDIDEDLEDALILGTEINRSPLDISAGEVPSPKEWLAIVRAHRQALGKLGIRAVISQRASLYGVRLAEQGVGMDWLGQMLLYKGMGDHDREKLSENAARLMPKVRQKLDVNKGEVAHGTEQRADDSEWFTPPEDKEIALEARHVPLISGLLPHELKASLDRALRYGILRDSYSRDVDLLLCLSWYLESKQSIEIQNDYQTSIIRHAADSLLQQSDSERLSVRISDIVDKADISEINPKEFAPHWDTDNSNIRRAASDRIESIQRDFPQLNISDVQAYAKQFEACHGFVPGVNTLCYWLSKHPDVGGRE